MPEQLKKLKLNRTVALTVLLIAVFIFAYIFILTYTYEKLKDAAADSVISATSNAGTNISMTIQTNSSQMDLLATELVDSGNFDKNSIKKYLEKNVPSDGVSLTFIYKDGFYITSEGKKGHLASFKNFTNATKLSPLFIPPTYTDGNPNLVHYSREIKSNGKIQGYLLGTYDYATTLSSSYSNEAYDEGSVNILFDATGSIILNTSPEDFDLYGCSNIFNFLADHGYDGEIPKKLDISTTYANFFTTDAAKYIIAIGPVEDVDDLFIARVLPSQSLFLQTGDLLLFMTLASLLFFFAIVLIAYRYYKSMTSTSNKIKNVAFTDPLTGYPNFAKFKEDAEETLLAHPNDKYYINCCDMIGFRYINDAFGYDVGDDILITITKEIDELLDDDELFARVAGDKFVILSKHDFSKTDENMFLYKLQDRISTIQPLSKSHIRLEVQLGIYEILPEDVNGDLSINALYDRCLVALYSIEHVDTGVAVYDISIHNEQIEKKNIESKMHQALKDGEFRVYVQPKYRTSNGLLAAGEALVRWVDPEKGIVPPIKFIPLFEQNRFVHDIDLYVMEVIARFQRMRLNEGLPVVPISLNISPVEFTMPGFRNSYIDIKDKYDIPDKLIELEFTEGIFFDNEELFKDVIRDFHAHGFTCSMDDFGSGYSSLNILKDLPVDTLKLDKLFFRESDNTNRDRSIIRSVVAMARSLNIKTVAEGVETLDVVEFLKLIGCTLIQGYIYSKPLPLTEFEERLNNEQVDTDDEFEYDFDKFEIVPLDMPLSNSVDSSLRRTYAGILELNAGGNIYHMYYPGKDTDDFDTIPERGFYTDFYEDLIPKYVHPKDLDEAKKLLNTMYLTNHFKQNSELDLEYRHMRKDGSYSWMKLHIIKASGGRTDSQIFFGYFNIIDDYKETEQNLSAAQTRFAAAYSNLNGIVFELDLEEGHIDILEAHSNMLAAVKDVHEYDKLVGFITTYLLHPDYQETINKVADLASLRKYFATNTITPLEVEVLAKPSRKVTRYNVYKASFSVQSGVDKLLVIVEDITQKKIAEAASDIRHHITDVAFANIYEKITTVNLEKDIYTDAVYPSAGNVRKASVSEGKYSLHWENISKATLNESDQIALSSIFSLEGLKNFYNDKSTSEFKLTFQEKDSPEDTAYHWKEALLVSVPEAYGQDPSVYIFKKTIDDVKEAEKNLNEYAHRLSYSLAMFDYAYTVDCNTGKVDIIGGLRFDPEIFGKEDITYNEVVTIVKNSAIAEEEQASFRRFTYIDELVNYFAVNPATITHCFKSNDEGSGITELSIIYGSRDQKITFFVRSISKDTIDAIEKGISATI